MSKSAAFNITKSKMPSGHTHHKVPKPAKTTVPPNSRGVTSPKFRRGRNF